MLRSVNAMGLKALSVILFACAIMARVIHSRKRYTITSAEDLKGNRRQDFLYSMYPYSNRDRSETYKNPYYYRLTSDHGKDSYQHHMDRIINNKIINDYQNEILEIPFLRQGQQATPPPPVRPPTMAPTSPPKTNLAQMMMTPPSISIASPVSPIAALYEPVRITQGLPPEPDIPMMTPMRAVVSHETYGQKLFRTGLNFLLTKTLILVFLLFEMLMVYISKVLIMKPLKYFMDTMTGFAAEMFS